MDTDRAILGDLLPSDSIHRICWFPPGYDKDALAKASSNYKLSYPWLVGFRQELDKGSILLEHCATTDIVLRMGEILTSLSMLPDLQKPFKIIFSNENNTPLDMEISHTYADIFEECVFSLINICQEICLEPTDISRVFSDFSLDMLFAIFNFLQHRSMSSDHVNALLCLAMFMLSASPVETCLMICDFGALDILANVLTRDDVEAEPVKNICLFIRELVTRVPSRLELPSPIKINKKLGWYPFEELPAKRAVYSLLQKDSGEIKTSQVTQKYTVHTDVTLKLIQILIKVASGVNQGFIEVVQNSDPSQTEQSDTMLTIIELFSSIMGALEVVIVWKTRVVMPNDKVSDILIDIVGEYLMVQHKTFMSPLFSFASTKLLTFLTEDIFPSGRDFLLSLFSNISTLAVYCLSTPNYSNIAYNQCGIVQYVFTISHLGYQLLSPQLVKVLCALLLGSGNVTNYPKYKSFFTKHVAMLTLIGVMYSDFSQVTLLSETSAPLLDNFDKQHLESVINTVLLWLFDAMPYITFSADPTTRNTLDTTHRVLSEEISKEIRNTPVSVFTSVKSQSSSSKKHSGVLLLEKVLEFVVKMDAFSKTYSGVVFSFTSQVKSLKKTLVELIPANHQSNGFLTQHSDVFSENEI